MRLVLLSFLIAILALPVRAEIPTPYSGTTVIETGQPFAAFIKRLTAAIKAPNTGISILFLGPRACRRTSNRPGVPITKNRNGTTTP